MSTSFEKISKNNASSQGKTDANLANDSNHLGGIEAEDYATKKYVQEYHDNKESSLKEYLDNQDNVKLGEAKEYANSLVRNQDFSNFAKTSDITALDTKLNNTINENVAEQKNYTDTKVESVVNDVNSNFEDVNEAITQLNTNQTELFQSVSDGKTKIAGAITDKGVSTSAKATFDTMANNIRNIKSGDGSIIVIPDGYMDTSDATASADKLLQGYTAYANGEKIHGTLIQDGSSTGGVVLGENEIVATKVYGEAGVLTGGKLGVATDISLNATTTSCKTALLCTKVYGDYIIASRKMSENIDDEIVIYNVSSTNQLYHKDSSSKFSYTLSELGIEGELRCIAASPIEYQSGIVQISIGTSVGIYTYLFEAKGNNKNGLIGKTINNKSKIVINNACGSYNAITYSNTDSNVFAYYNGYIHIVEATWFIEQDVIEWTNVRARTYADNVSGLFRFSSSDRFLMFAPWGSVDNPEVHIMLLNDFVYVVHQKITNTKTESGWSNGQIAINSKDNFMILFGKPYYLEWNIEDKTIIYTKISDTSVIPYVEGNNESLYATFSSDDKYVYAIMFNQGTTSGMFPLCCFKVDYSNTSTQWANVSNILGVPKNSDGSVPAGIDIVNKKIIGFSPFEKTQGFYCYYSDSNVKELIGLSYNGNLYNRA